MTKLVNIPDHLPQLWPMFLDGTLNVAGAIVILVFGWAVARWMASWVRAGLSRIEHFDNTLRPLVASLVYYAILIVTVMAVLERFGVQTTSIVAMLGAAGIAIGLALQGSLANVASGVLLLLLRSVRAGEEIVTNGFDGVVREVGLFRTILITGDGLHVSIPNTMLFSAPIVNNSREPLRQFTFKILVHRSADVAKLRTMILDQLGRDQRVLKKPPPAVVVSDLGDINLNVTLTVQAWASATSLGDAQADAQRDALGAVKQIEAQAQDAPRPAETPQRLTA